MAGRKHLIWNREAECMDREALRRLQGERLVRTVKWEYEHVPMYRQRMDERGVRPEDIRTVDDIGLLPFMEKTDLRDGWPYGLFAAPMRDIVRVHGSSGTTGHPIISGYTRGDIEVWSEMMARTLTGAGCTADDIVQVGYGFGLFTGGFGAYHGAETVGAMVVPMSSGNTQRQILMMRELGTTVLCCTPSYALFLGETIREMGLEPGKDIRLRAGCLGAEPWTEAMRVRIEQLLGIDACDIYGLTEMAGPGVAFECLEKKGMHINEDHIIAETIDPDTGRVLPYGSKGELVLTTITKTGMPMLRYRTHDICTLDPTPCACGRTTLRMTRITGRSDDMLVIRGVNVFPSQIETILVRTEGVAPHYQLVVERVNCADTLEVRAELAPELAGASEEMVRALQRRTAEEIRSVVGISVKVTLLEPKTLPRSEGKAQRVIDNRRLD